MSFTSTPLDGSSTPIPMSSAVPDGTNTPLAVEGGPSKSTGGNTLVPVATYQYDGYNVTQGAQADPNTANTVMGRLTKLRDMIVDVWDGTNHWLQVKVMNGNANGQATMANSAPVVIASNQSAVPTNLSQLGGSTISATNPIPVNSVAQAGIVAAYGSNPAALTANTDAAFKWGAGGTTPVNHILIANNTAATINYELDAATNAGSDVLTTGQKITLDVAGTTSAHLQSSGTPNLNGSSASNIVIRGWL